MMSYLHVAVGKYLAIFHLAGGGVSLLSFLEQSRKCR